MEKSYIYSKIIASATSQKSGSDPFGNGSAEEIENFIISELEEMEIPFDSDTEAGTVDIMSNLTPVTFCIEEQTVASARLVDGSEETVKVDSLEVFRNIIKGNLISQIVRAHFGAGRGF